MSHPLPEMLQAVIAQVRSTVDVNTSIGDPITTPNGVTILPVSKISFGIGGGGGDYTTKHASANGQNPFGGGSGAGVTIQPIAFLVIKDDSVRLLPIAEPPSGALERLIEQAPELLNKISEMTKKKKEKPSEEETAEI